MKPKSNYSKQMAAVYILMGYLSTLFIQEIICFLTFYPMLEDHKVLQILSNVIWLYAGTYIYYKLTRRYTKWWKRLENKGKDNANGDKS